MSHFDLRSYFFPYLADPFILFDRAVSAVSIANEILSEKQIPSSLPVYSRLGPDGYGVGDGSARPAPG